MGNDRQSVCVAFRGRATSCTHITILEEVGTFVIDSVISLLLLYTV